MIRLKPAAVKEIKRLQSKRPNQNLFFRLQVQAGGCSGLLYCLSFAAVANPDDAIYDCSGVTVVLDRQSLNYVGTLMLDYSEDLMGGGFRFQNSQAIASCGCGNSFAVDPAAAQS